jgi:hypothetical protein
MKKHLLITYTDPSENGNHVDPDFNKLLYGDSGDRGYILMNNLEKGSYVFFNTNIDGKRYITAFYYVEKILLKDKDNDEISKLESDAQFDEVIISGNREKSIILSRPVLLDKYLVMKLPSLKADINYFDEKQNIGTSELCSINYKTRTPRKLKDIDKDILLQVCKNKG